ncbi:sugar phosphate isomerase/epimerase family protein [Agrobacterium rosae]|uniref:sugar phosphate isomerase/epimerase family protein n=1 Tax=Agrobacterium rosae TaxID=1972867 RepID=UPI003BA040CD
MTAFDYCFSTLGCSQLNLHQVADLAARHGIKAVELRTLSGTVDLLSALDDEFDNPTAFAQFLDQRQLDVMALNTSVRLFESTDLCALDPFIAWAEAANIDFLRIFDGGNQLSDEGMNRASQLLDRWQELRGARGLNVDLMIETHDALANAEQLLTFIDKIPTAKILWDTHHTWAKSGDVSGLWSHIEHNIVHLHVKDSRMNEDCHRQYTLPGEGDFPMSELLSSLHSSENRMSLSLEWERHWHPELPPLDEALMAARVWWQQGDA